MKRKYYEWFTSDRNIAKYLEMHVKDNQRVINISPYYGSDGWFKGYYIYIEETVADNEL